MKKVMVVFGTRPEAIKMAPVIEELKRNGSIRTIVVVTGQHKEMLDQVLALFNITPDYNLQVMTKAQGLTGITVGVLTGLEPIISNCKPDLVMVHGDTSTTLSAALAAYYKHVPVAHVEAGLRTGNIYSPWPEEVNRKLTASIARLHFAPTESASINLLNEGVSPERIFTTGNTVIDALFEAVSVLQRNEDLTRKLDEYFSLDNGKRLIVVTGHRRENFGEGIAQVCAALKAIAHRGDVQIIYPLHLNPSVKVPVEDALKGVDGIHLIAPCDYLPFIHLMHRSYLIISDSGGVQEEAPSLGRPVLVTRTTTERPEAVRAGTVKLVGTDSTLLVTEAFKLLDNPIYYNEMSSANNPYGDGMAAKRISKEICSFLGLI